MVDLGSQNHYSAWTVRSLPTSHDTGAISLTFESYIFSYPLLWLCRVFHVTANTTTQLRSLNMSVLTFALFAIARQLVFKAQGRGRPDSSFLSSHVAFNICLFPPIFFFSGLYYTDIFSVTVVLQAYLQFISRQHLHLFLTCLVALCFRQTNIFWTAVYIGALDALRTLQELHLDADPQDRYGFLDVVKKSWGQGYLYDPLISSASFEGSA